jgi:hypothetical protein
MVAQTAITRSPHRFDGLVLMDTSHRGLRVDPGLVELGVAVARSKSGSAALRTLPGYSTARGFR